MLVLHLSIRYKDILMTVFNGYDLRFSVSGDDQKPPLLLIHGYLSGRQVWRTMLPWLQPHFRCIAVDLIGHGDSERPDVPHPYHITEQAQRLAALMAAEVGTDYSVMGHSMGGQIALMLAAQVDRSHITRVVDIAGVVLPCLHPRMEKNLRRQVALGYRFPLLLSLIRPLIRRSPKVARQYTGNWFYQWGTLPFADWRTDRYLISSPRIERAMRHSLDAIHSADLSTLVADIQAPVLAVHGEEDAVVPFSHSQRLQEALPATQLVAIPHCGHFPMYETPQALQTAVMDFFAQPIR